MSVTNTCPECHEPLTGEICHACLIKQACESGTKEDETPHSLPPVSPEEIADKFPAYEVLECLGRGGMGVVYKARQKSLNRLVAIKILAPEREHDASFAERFVREAEILAKLNHPEIVTIYDFGETGGLYFFVMEFIDGVNLRDVLRDGKLEPQQALAVVPQICEALQFAHEQGVIHRDIKPENILLDRLGNVKIADFGVASLVDENATKSVGTPAYMAPEAHADHRADIYALGVVFYEMLTGERPTADLIKPSQKVQVDVKIDQVVLRALERTPELRYQTVGEFTKDLQTLAEPETTKIKSLRSRKKNLALAMGAVALLSLISFVIFYPPDEAPKTTLSPPETQTQPTTDPMKLKDITKAVATAAIATTIAKAEPEPVSRKDRDELKQEARQRARQDHSEYSRQELGELEELYQIANENWKKDRRKAKKAMKELVKKYKKANRTGCAMLYLGQLSYGDERDEYLKKAIKDYSGCYYFNGVQVGGFARYLRLHDLKKDGKDRDAEKLEKEIRRKYKKAITHSGYLIVELLDHEKSD